MTVDLYKDGKFFDIDYPFVEAEDICTDQELEQFFLKCGYMCRHSYGFEEMPIMKVYAYHNITADCQFPYFVFIDLCGEGREIFFENYRDLMHFITNYGGFAMLSCLTIIQSQLEEIAVKGEDYE